MRNIDIQQNSVIKIVSKQEANIASIVYPNNTQLLLERPQLITQGNKKGKWKLIMRKFIPATTILFKNKKINKKAFTMLKKQINRLHNAGYAHKNINVRLMLETEYNNTRHYSMKRQLLVHVNNNIITEMYLTDFGLSSKNKNRIFLENIYFESFIQKLKNKPPVGSPVRTPVGSPVRTPVGSPVRASMRTPVRTPVRSPLATIQYIPPAAPIKRKRQLNFA
jgi:hypothetical protein